MQVLLTIGAPQIKRTPRPRAQQEHRTQYMNPLENQKNHTTFFSDYFFV